MNIHVKCQWQKKREKREHIKGWEGVLLKEYLHDGYHDGSDVYNLQKVAAHDDKLHMEWDYKNLQKEADVP